MEITVTTGLSKAEFDLFQSIGGDTPHNRNKFLSTLLHNALEKRIKWVNAFNSRIEKSDDSCWKWTGGKIPSGYGITRHPDTGKSVLAHRMAYELARGPIRAGLIVLHTCDNPVCVNPDHHVLGTHKENTADMYSKGRQNFDGKMLNQPRGQSHYKAILTAVQVAEIRALYAQGETSYSKLGRQFGVTKVAIGEIIRGESWAIEHT